MDIRERARRSAKHTFFFIEKLIWRIIWLEVLPDKYASSIEKRGICDGLWYISSSLYSGDKVFQKELDLVIHLLTGLDKGGKPQINLRKFIIDEMGWFNATGRPAVIGFSCDESETNIEIMMECIHETSDYVRTKEFKHNLECALLKCKCEEDYENHYHQIVNRWLIDDYCVDDNRIPRLRAEIAKQIRRLLASKKFVHNTIEDQRMLLRGKILGENENMARTVQQHALQNEVEFEDLLLKKST